MEEGTTVQDYGLISLMHDGPSGNIQITIGLGWTELTSDDLKKVLISYINSNGLYGNDFKKYIDNGFGNPPSRYNDSNLIQLLKQAGSDPVMKKVQDDLWNKLYFYPALAFCTKNGLTYPLSVLVVYDSFVQSGSVPMYLRNQFTENIPVNGGDEKNWVSQYTQIRDHWLSNSANQAVRNSAYRTKVYLKLIKDGNWLLNGSIDCNGCIVN